MDQALELGTKGQSDKSLSSMSDKAMLRQQRQSLRLWRRTKANRAVSWTHRAVMPLVRRLRLSPSACTRARRAAMTEYTEGLKASPMCVPETEKSLSARSVLQ
jgi:hypothetical protein